VGIGRGRMRDEAGGEDAGRVLQAVESKSSSEHGGQRGSERGGQRGSEQTGARSAVGLDG